MPDKNSLEGNSSVQDQMAVENNIMEVTIMSGMDLVENRGMRDQVAGRIEVLDKVKALFLLPKLKMATFQQLADYYEVGIETIKSCYKDNRVEIDADGAILQTKSMAKLKVPEGLLAQDNVSSTFDLGEGIVLRIPNRGLRMFPKRAVLRFGMLLRDSKVAEEVRTQLLNVFEKTSDEQKVEDIDEEFDLMKDIVTAFAAGDITGVCEGSMKLDAFRKRHIAELTEKNEALEHNNAELEKVNEGLVHNTRTWDKRKILVALLRSLAYWRFGGDYARTWGVYYKELQYKKGIALSKRDGNGKLLDRLHEDEWDDAIEVAVAMCESFDLDVAKVINETNAAAVR